MNPLEQLDYLSTAKVWAFFLITAVGFAFLVSGWLATSALFPRFSRSCQERFTRPFLCFVVGVVVAVVTGGLLAIFTGLHFQLGGFATITASVTLGVAGLSGLARRIGAGMISGIDKEQPWRRTFRGSLVLGLLFCPPFLGWFVLVIFLVAGMGCSVLGILSLRKEARSKSDTQEDF